MRLIQILLTSILILVGCAKKPDDASTSRSLYVASGSCLSGIGNTAPAPLNIIYKVNLDTGAPGEIIIDYAVPPSNLGDSPTGIADVDGSTLVVSVDNTTATGVRRVEKVSKQAEYTPRNFYTLGGITPAAAPRGVVYQDDGTIFAGRTASVEKLSNTAIRRAAGSNASWVLASQLAAPCAATSISSVQVTPKGRTIFTNYASLQGRVAAVNPNGLTAAAECSSGVNAALTTAYPTASLYLADYGQLLVLFAGNNSADNNYIAVYDFDDTTGVISNEGVAFKDTSIIYGGSAMTLDKDTGKIYVATANNTTTVISNYNIEQFSYNPATRKLTRATTMPFATGWAGSKCISSMFVGN